MNRKIVVGIAGLGTVGSGLVDMLELNREDMLRRTGYEIEIKKIAVSNLSKKRNIPQSIKLTNNALELANDPDIKIVIELMGGVDTAKRLIVEAIKNGKSVVTANKALLAKHGLEIFTLAKEHHVSVRYEASVAGAIPIIQTMKNSLAGNHITSFKGIFNGTSNYILSEMNLKGENFDTVLKKAQQIGLAEADPSLDIDGFDAAHKLIILIFLAWGKHYPLDSLPITGIRDIDPVDINFAKKFGYRIKLIAHAKEIDGKIEAGVFPVFVHSSLLLAHVNGAYNAVRVAGNAVGNLFLHGLGAGGHPTASAVLGDILGIIKSEGNFAISNITGFADDISPAEIYPPDEVFLPWYVRVTVHDNPGVLRDIAAIFAEEGISFAQIIQTAKENEKVSLVVMTHETTVRAIKQATSQLFANGILLTPAVYYRIYESSDNEAESN